MKYEIKQNNPVVTKKLRNGTTARPPWSSFYGTTHISNHRTRQGALEQMAKHRRLKKESDLEDIRIERMMTAEYEL